jgi:hypothetical protein
MMLRLALLVVCVLANGAFAFVASLAAGSPLVSLQGRVVGAALTSVLIVTVGLLIASRIRPLPVVLTRWMAGLCAASPLLWLLAAAEQESIQPGEWLLVAAAIVIAVATWFAYRMQAPRPTQPPPPPQPPQEAE